MSENKQGAKQVKSSTGATISELLASVPPFSRAWSGLAQMIIDGIDRNSKTNIALTGEPLTQEDLERIAEFE
jgi:hypothetical protein